MAAPLSVIIPTLNAMGSLGPCLAALAEGLEQGLIAELILSDGGSVDEIALLADAAGARLVVGPAGRGGQLAAGAAVARGAWLLFLQADTCLQHGWAAASLSHIRNHPATAGYFALRPAQSSLMARLVSGWGRLRGAWHGLPQCNQALLISRALHDEIGGYSRQPPTANTSIAHRLKGRLRRMDGVAPAGAYRGPSAN